MAVSVHEERRRLKIRWLPAAMQNRFEQLSFIARENAAAAIRLDQAIERQTDRLGETPFMGREGRVEGTRELVIGRSPFIVVYRVRDEVVEILRVLHGAQRWPPA